MGLWMTGALVIANSTRATASLSAFVLLPSTAAVLVVYLLGALAVWKENHSPTSRAVYAIALLFILFAFCGAGMEADLRCLVLLAIGVCVRVLMRAFNSRVGSILAVAPLPVAPLE